MKSVLMSFFMVASFVSIARADFSLAHNQKAVTCYADDNQSWNLNAKRTSVKYTVEGESLGAKKITQKKTDGETFVSYVTSEGTLTLSDQGDTYQFKSEQDAHEVRCK